MTVRCSTMRRAALAAALMAAALAIPGLAGLVHAQSCTVSATAAAFGPYSPASPLPTDTTASIQLSCQSATPRLVTYQVALSPGTSGTYAGRSLRSGSGALGYQIYGNLPRTAVWGDGTGGTVTVGGSVLAAAVPVVQGQTAYARIPPRQNVPPGAYADTVVVSVTW